MKTIGKYRVRGLLGRGGAASVYKVEAPVLGRLAALKLFNPRPPLAAALGEGELKRRFVAEARLMAGLRHPNLAQVWDFDYHGDRPFYVMEYFCQDLGLWLGEGPRPSDPCRTLGLEAALEVARQVLRGLEALHSAGIVHRDLKPGNVLFSDLGEAKLADMGLAKIPGDNWRPPKNLKVGSPGYAAPEQERDPRAVDPRADLFSLGVMLLRMLTGRVNLEKEERASRLNPLLDGYWDAFFHKALAKRPEERFPDARAMAATVEDLARAWEENLGKTCALPPLETAYLEAPPPIPTGEEKVPPREARERFGLDGLWRPRAYWPGELREAGDGCLYQAGSGLLWQTGGSPHPLGLAEAGEYLAELKRKRLAGREDWRLPRVEELCLLLRPPEPSRPRSLCQPEAMDPRQRRLWSGDRASYIGNWCANLELGFIYWQDCTCPAWLRAVAGPVKLH